MKLFKLYMIKKRINLISVFIVMLLCLQHPIQALATDVSKNKTGESYVSGFYRYTIKDDGTAELSFDYQIEPNLETINIPSTIDGYVVSSFSGPFFYDKNPTTINFPSTIREVNCIYSYSDNRLKNINVDTDNPYLKSVDGVLFNKDMTELIAFPNGRTEYKNTTMSYKVPEGIKVLRDSALYCCYFSNLKLPDSLEHICRHSITMPTSSELTIPKNVKKIDDFGISSSYDASVYILNPSVIIGEYALGYNQVGGINEKVYGYQGSTAEEYVLRYQDDNNGFYDSISFSSLGDMSDGIHIYSDHSNLSIKQGDSLTVGAGLFKDNNQINDVSKMTYMIEDTSIVKATDTSIHDNCLFVKLSSQSVGTTYITFSDSNTGYTLRTPVTVYDNSKSSYTISGVPVYYQPLNTNFFNANGLCIDNYKYSVNSDKTTTVSFDVYNSKYTYGAVEVYDSNGNIRDVVSIKKMKMNNTSIKSSVWDNTCNLVSDFVTGDITNYRSKLETAQTFVSVKIPENGYIVITNDPSESVTVAVVNAVDMLMSLKSVAGSISNFDTKSDEFATRLTKKMVLDTAYKDLYKNQYKYTKNILKGISKDALFSTESLGNFANTILNNLQIIDADKLIKDSAIEFGWSFGESVFKELAGPVGQVMNGLFAFGKLGNLIVQENAFVTSFEAGSITVQNQGGGVRNASQVTVTSETNFNSETALKVFRVTANNDLLRLIEHKQPDIYNTITSGVTETYNISMIKNGAEEQPNGIVEVYIPLHDEMSIFAHSGIFKVYRVELDGALTDMNAEYKNGSMVFKTNHFSYYMVVAYNENDNPTDNITEPQTDNPTQPTTDKPTEPVVTQPSTEAPTQSTTEAPKTTSKKPNPIKVSVKKKTVKLKKLKKKAQTVKAITVKNAKGKVTYKLVAKGITKSIRKLVKISSKGVITIKRWKKAKTGDYKIKLKITAKGNKGYNRKTVTRTVKIRIE